MDTSRELQLTALQMEVRELRRQLDFSEQKVARLQETLREEAAENEANAKALREVGENYARLTEQVEAGTIA